MTRGMARKARDFDLYAADLFGELHLAEAAAPTRGDGLRALWPGLALCAVAAGAAAWLADHYHFPIILLGLLIGLALNFAAQDKRVHAGLDMASGLFLRVGIVLLGFQVTVAEVATLGWAGFGAILLIMVLTFGAGVLGARLSGQSPYAGIIAGGATAICGASAALALYALIGKERLSQAQFALTLIGISLASALAMSFYPMLAQQWGMGDKAAGFLIGASIHDVAQAIGGGYSFSNPAGVYATIVKLSRVTLLAPVVVLVGLWLGRSGVAAGGKDKPLWRRFALPWFVSGFLALVALHSLIPVDARLAAGALTLSKALLLLAVTATAMRSRPDLLLQLGWRAAVPIISATLVSFVAALSLTHLLF